MRHLTIQVPRGEAHRVLEIADEHGAADVVTLEGMRRDEPLDVIHLNIANRELEPLLDKLEVLPELHVALAPRGILALRPPSDEAPEQVTDVELRSPLEIFLGGLQSIGSWRGFLGYAAAAGIVVWIGLFTNTSYLLVAAMLIAPFAGPAMNLALGSARGDTVLMRRGVLRYVIALAVTIATAFVLSLVMGQDVATTQMIARSQISTVAVLLPLVAGAAGALNLMQSERSSLVSGAATGMLVAASLAPPAGIVGMAAALGDFDMVKSGSVLLVLQLAGIHLTGAVLFRLHGLSPRGARYERGRKRVFAISIAASAVVLAGMLTWQFGTTQFQRPTDAQRATAIAKRIVDDSGLAHPVEIGMRFTRADIPGQRTLLGVIYVQLREGVTAEPSTVERRLAREIEQELLRVAPDLVPLVQVQALEPPRPSAAAERDRDEASSGT